MARFKTIQRYFSWFIQVGPDRFKWNLHKDETFSVWSMYLHKLDHLTLYRNKDIWKLKIPLKIKFFLWLLNRGFTLTKDNLARKNWKGDKKCCFCNYNETIQHLFLESHDAKELWHLVFYATRLTPPTSVSHMLGNWLSNQDRKIRSLILVGISAFCWAIWGCRNDIIVFKKSKYS